MTKYRLYINDNRDEHFPDWHSTEVVIEACNIDYAYKVIEKLFIVKEEWILQED